MQLKSTPFFESHNITVSYALAAWLSEVYPEWQEWKDELEELIYGAKE